jgi:TolA-binding protein
MIMRTFVSALLALSVLAGVAAPASAFDAKSLFQQLDRESGGGSN